MQPIDIAKAGAHYFTCLDRGLYLRALGVLLDEPQIDVLSVTPAADLPVIIDLLGRTERVVRGVAMQAKCRTVRERIAGLWAYCAACGDFKVTNHPVGDTLDLPFAHVGTHVCKGCEDRVIVEPASIVVIGEGYLV